MVPVDPPPTRWAFPDDVDPESGEVVGVGADLDPGTILAAYRAGLFPMPVDRGTLAWWSPDPRGVLPLDALRVSRSLRKACARFEIRVDTAFDEVVAACADRSRPGAWISRPIQTAYGRLHRLGWAHSVEAWSDDGSLAGGLYGLAIGGLFAGESMFHRSTDASKVALVGLVALLVADDGTDGPADLGRLPGRPTDRLLDVQWSTDHLASLGVIAVPRSEYRLRLRRALDLPLPAVFS